MKLHPREARIGPRVRACANVHESLFDQAFDGKEWRTTNVRCADRCAGHKWLVRLLLDHKQSVSGCRCESRV